MNGQMLKEQNGKTTASRELGTAQRELALWVAVSIWGKEDALEVDSG